MGISLEEFKSNIIDLARPNRFRVFIFDPIAIETEYPIEWEYYTKTASIPERSFGDIELSWFGKKMKVAGDPVYNDVDVTFLNDSDFKVKKYFEKWMDLIANTNSDERMSDYDNYKSIMTITQLGSKGQELAKYECFGVYPKTVNSIELSMDSSDSIEEIQVSFSIDYWLAGEIE